MKKFLTIFLLFSVAAIVFSSCERNCYCKNLEEGTCLETRMYPNPVDNILTISADEEIQQISIYNILSVKVMEMTLNNKEAVLDLSNLESGMYLIEILGKNEKSIKTFIKE